MAGLNVTARNALLDGNSAVWPPDSGSLHSTDPGSGSSPAVGTELTGGSPSYARKSLAWNAAAAGSKSLDGTPVFDIPAGGVVAYLGYWRGATYLGCRQLTAAETYTGQGTYTLTSLTEQA